MKLELEHFLSQHGFDICPLSETFLKPGQTFRISRYVCHLMTDRQWGRHSHPSPPWYFAQLRARSGLDPHGGHCHPGHSGRKTDDSPCGWPFELPPTDRRGPNCLFLGGLLILMAGDLNGKYVDLNSRT